MSKTDKQLGRVKPKHMQDIDPSKLISKSKKRKKKARYIVQRQWRWLWKDKWTTVAKCHSLTEVDSVVSKITRTAYGRDYEETVRVIDLENEDIPDDKNN